MNRIDLKFNKTLTVISGSDFGEKIFDEQVSGKVDYQGMNEIDFGQDIRIIGISFVQGFTKEIFKHIDRNEFFEHFRIVGNQKAVERFYKAIKY